MLYAKPKEEHVALLGKVLEESPELDAIHDLKPRIVIVLRRYDDTNMFDKAAEKARGAHPVKSVCLDDRTHFVTSEFGKKSDPGIDWLIYVDPAPFSRFPERAQMGMLYNELARMTCDRDRQGDWKVKGDVGGKNRYAWRKLPIAPIMPAALAKFGPFSDDAQAITEAVTKGSQLDLWDWKPDVLTEEQRKARDELSKAGEEAFSGGEGLRETEGSPAEGSVEQREAASS